MSRTEIMEKILSCIEEVSGKRPRTEDQRESASYKDDIGLDSLDRVELVMNLEQVFEIQVSEDESEKIVTIGDTITLIEEKLKLRST